MDRNKTKHSLTNWTNLVGIIHDHSPLLEIWEDEKDVVRFDPGFYYTVNLFLGKHVHFSPNVTIMGGMEMSFYAFGFNNIMTGSHIYCASDRFDGSGLPGWGIPKDQLGTVIKENVIMEEFSNLGTNAILLPGSHLRKGVLVTAGSLFMGDSEEWGVYKGNPAKLVHKIDGTKIIENAKKLGYEG